MNMNETAKTFIIKILTNNLIHHEFQYVHGINVDIKNLFQRKLLMACILLKLIILVFG